MELKHKDLTEKIIGIIFKVFNELGFGYYDGCYYTSWCRSEKNFSCFLKSCFSCFLVLLKSFT